MSDFEENEVSAQLGWRQMRLDAITRHDRPIVYGIIQAGPHVEGGVPYIRSSDVGRQLRPSALMRTSPEIARRYRRSAVEAGDLVYSLRGNIGSMSLVPSELGGANLTQGTARISVSGEHCTQFIMYALQAPHVIRQINRVAKGSTFHEISLDQLRKVELALPPVEEQRKIAAVLGTWEKAEHQLEATLNLKSRFKQELMQRLLTGMQRFEPFRQLQGFQHTPAGKFPADWTIVRIGNLFKKVQRKNGRGVDRVLTASGRHGLVDQRDYFNRAVAGKSLQNYSLLRRGEFAYNRSTMRGYPYGAIKRLDRYNEGVVSTLYLCFTLTSQENCDADFFKFFFESGLLNRQLRGIAHIGARAHGLLNVSATEFFDLRIPVPSGAEQRSIANVLRSLDKEIDLLKEQLGHLKAQKRGLMQQLLTGQLRLKV